MNRSKWLNLCSLESVYPLQPLQVPGLAVLLCFYSEYHLFEDLNPQNAVKDHKSKMYTWLCLMESQYILGGRMFPKKTKQTCYALTVHFQKSCGTQVQHSTGGAFEPAETWGGLLFICFDGAF